MRVDVRGWGRGLAPGLVFLAWGVVGTGPAAMLQPGAARTAGPVAYGLIAVAALALALQRPPEAGLVVNVAAVAGYLGAGYPYGPILFTVPAAVFGVAARRAVPRAVVVTAAVVGVLFAASFAKRVREPLGFAGAAPLWQAVVWAAVLAAACAIGVAVRVRRESLAGVRAEQARRVASEERLRMAQDLHDTIGHGLAAIAMQAGVALHVLDRDPAAVRRALEAVRATSHDSLESLRTQLDSLRRPDADGLAPAHGLDDLAALADRVRAGGVAVRVDSRPDLPDLPPAVDDAAYRIVQESLTNVLRHAGADAVRITIARDAGDLLLDVTDTGRSRVRPRPEGSGIRGMRARAESLGGAVWTGPAAGGGFTVTARLPLRTGGPA